MHGGRDGRHQAAWLPRTIPLVVVAFAILTFGSNATGQDSALEDLSKWIEISIDQDANYWRRANGSSEWVVSLRNGRPSVRALKSNFDPKNAVWGEDRDKLPFAVKGDSAKEGLV